MFLKRVKLSLRRLVQHLLAKLMHNYHRVLVKLRVCNGQGWVGVIVGMWDHDVHESVR